MMVKNVNLVGCCGISCGLCPRFQSKAKSRCLGCGVDNHCSYCSIFRCSSLKRNYETCTDCNDFPCEKFEKWFDNDSFVSHQKCLTNIEAIKKIGIEKFVEEQKERKKVLEKMLEKFNSGRNASLFCLAATLMTIKSLKEAMEIIEKSNDSDKPKAFKNLILKLAKEEGVSLKLRK